MREIRTAKGRTAVLAAQQLVIARVLLDQASVALTKRANRLEGVGKLNARPASEMFVEVPMTRRAARVLRTSTEVERVADFNCKTQRAVLRAQLSLRAPRGALMRLHACLLVVCSIQRLGDVCNTHP